MIKTISTIEEFEKVIKENLGVVFYFSTPECNVCKILKPKLIELIEESFPKLEFFYIDCSLAVELASQKSVFAVPTILVYFDGKEFIRKSRNLSLAEFEKEISRPYTMLFE